MPTSRSSCRRSRVTTATLRTTSPTRCSPANRASVREFLLDTSVLHRMSGPLCDAVTGRNDSQRILEHLERSGLFVIRLDDRRHWFRYHSLLRDLLRYELRASDRARQRDRLRRAAAWHTDHNDLEVAAEYLVAAELWDELIEFLQTHGPSLLERGTIGAVNGWLEMAPEEITLDPDRCRAHLGGGTGHGGPHTRGRRDLGQLAVEPTSCPRGRKRSHTPYAASMVQFHLPADVALREAEHGLRLLDEIDDRTRPGSRSSASRHPTCSAACSEVAKGRSLHHSGDLPAARDVLTGVVENDDSRRLAVRRRGDRVARARRGAARQPPPGAVSRRPRAAHRATVRSGEPRRVRRRVPCARAHPPPAGRARPRRDQPGRSAPSDPAQRQAHVVVGARPRGGAARASARIAPTTVSTC